MFVTMVGEVDGAIEGCINGASVVDGAMVGLVDGEEVGENNKLYPNAVAENNKVEYTY